MTLEEMEKQQKEADAVLGASDADNCSYSKGLLMHNLLVVDNTLFRLRYETSPLFLPHMYSRRRNGWYLSSLQFDMP